MSKQFDIRFDPNAAKEYQALDGSVIDVVDKAIDELEERADEVGKPLGNTKNTKLAGCKEIKLRSDGIRIIFRITDEYIDILRIVHILAIAKRDKDCAFVLAAKRYAKSKKQFKIRPRRK